ncbi:MAG: hypothetical protein L0Y37_06100 [Bacteroidales bacterium]|nr:hypothetical protein [Bacteroidales bacterium]
MIKKSKVILAWLLTSLLPVILSGQENPADLRSAGEKLEDYGLIKPFEELWLHTDREIYVSGEAVRIKGYLLSYPDLILASCDSYVYAEILSCDNRPVAQATMMIEEGSGTVMLYLPDTLSSGPYMLRAYTAVMKNYLPHGCFMKSITVVNPFSDRQVNLFTGTKFRNDPPSKIFFLPEGGNLINGVENRTGIITLNKYGYPVACSGWLQTEEGLIVADVMCDSSGTSLPSFIPEKGVQYYFVPEATAERFPLPAVSDEGIILSADYNEEGLVTISARQITGKESSTLRSGIILVQSRGKILLNEKVNFRNQEFNTIIPAGELSPGINNIALFDAEGNFLRERYIFIPVPGVNQPVIQCTHPVKRRDNVRIEIEGLVAGSGSLSVSVPSPGKQGLLASEYLMLGSEIRLPVNLPFQRESFPALSTKTKNILLLGATSNWIDWMKITSGSFEQNRWFEEREGRFLYMTQPGNEDPGILPRPRAYLTAFGFSPSFQYAEEDSTGRFIFFLEKKKNIKNIIIRVDSGGTSMPVSFENRYSERYIPSEFPADTTPSESEAEAEQLMVRYQVRKIYGITDTASLIPVLPVRPPAFRLYGRADLEVLLEDYISLSSMREIFFELIKIVSVRTGRGEEGSVIYDPLLKRSPALFIDLVPVDDADIILNLNPAHVKQIDVITGDYMVGNLLFPGIISVTTHEGNYNDIRLPDNSIRIPWKMYDESKAFFTPDYSVDEASHSRLPDFRNTLYWNDGHAIESGETTVYEFPVSDDTQDYQINFNMFNHKGDIISVRSKLSLSGIL